MLTNLVIDDQTEVSHLQDGFLGDCDNVFIYMSDSTNPGILVYDARRDTAWRLSHPFMYPDPDFGTMSVSHHGVPQISVEFLRPIQRSLTARLTVFVRLDSMACIVFSRLPGNRSL